MKILVFGNIGTGKSTLIKNVNSFFDYEVVAIDDFRKMYSDGTIDGERVAQKLFLKKILENNDQFVECCGVGKVGNLIYATLSFTFQPIICVILRASPKVCYGRVINRVWDTPYPSITNKKLLIKSIDLLFKTKENKYRWNYRMNTTVFEYESVFPEDIKNISKELIKIIETNI